MSAQPIIICNGSIGFVFLMKANRTPTYSIADIANDNLLGTTTDGIAFVSKGWPSDPGDSVFPALTAGGGRDYATPGAAEQAPNNIRLSQVPLISVRASHGISRGLGQENLPTSSNFGSNGLNTNNTLAGSFPTIGNLGGFSRITVSIMSPVDTGNLLVNCSVQLNTAKRFHTFNEANLGLIQVVNLDDSDTVLVGVHCEVSG